MMRQSWIWNSKRTAVGCCAVWFATAMAAASVAEAVGPEARPDTAAMFSLERARRAQERAATAAAQYRPELSWPVGAADADRTRWLAVTAGAEFDEEPVMLSNGLGPPDELAKSSHGAGLWFADLGTRLFDTEHFGGGIAAAYFGEAWSDWDKDTHYPTIATWLDWKIGETWAIRAQYDVGTSVVDNESYATTHFLGPRIYKDWRDAGVSELGFEYYYLDFNTSNPDPAFGPRNVLAGGLCKPALTPRNKACAPRIEKTEGSRLDRTGWGFTFGAEHRVDLDWNDTEIRGGYFYTHFIPDGANFHNQSHELWAQVTTSLPWGFVLENNLSVMYQGARNVTQFPDGDTLRKNRVYSLPGDRRKDLTWRNYTAIGREITRNVSASVEYAFTDHSSNQDGWDYARHRIGGFLTVHFD